VFPVVKILLHTAPRASHLPSVTIESSSGHETLHPNTYMKKLCCVLALALFASVAVAQNVPDGLRPPKGSQIAIVIFEDLQCPDCRRATPLVEQAARTYKIPLIVRDFPLPMHNWSYQAALIARYLRDQSPELGRAYRDYIFEHQMEIYPGNLRAYSERFAAEHKVDLPFVVDPQGKLAAEINADRDLGRRIGIDHTPTIFLVTNKNQRQPFVEVKDRSQLFQMIDAIKAE
jgi:protein-disulfide isomerase